jgi:hypothetical protein
MTRSTYTRPLTWAAIGALALVFAASPVQFGPSLDVDAWANGSHGGASGPPGGDKNGGGDGGGSPDGSGNGSPGKSGSGNS